MTAATEISRPALRYHGGKFRLAPWVMQFLPPHRTYVEPFGGAAGVLLRKPRAYAEVYNDLDGDVVNLFRVLRDEDQRARLIELLALTPYARAEFDAAWTPTDEPVEQARRTAIRAGMGFGSGGATKGSTGFRSDVKRAYTTAMMDWANYTDGLRAVGERFAGVLIENRPALEVLRHYDGPDVLHFVDPPYVHATRKMRQGQRVYRHEMTDAEHLELLELLELLQGMVVLCGYDNDVYAGRLRGWARHRTQARISAGRGTGLRTEVLWLNPACQQALADAMGGLFARDGRVEEIEDESRTADEQERQVT